MFFSEDFNNIESVANKLLNCHGINVRGTDLKKALRNNDSTVDMYDLKNALEHFGLITNAYRVSFEELVEIPAPFIVHTTSVDETYLLVNRITRDKIIISSRLAKRRKISSEEFKSIYSGITLLVNKKENENAEWLSLGERLFSRKTGIIGLIAVLIMLVAGRLSSEYARSVFYTLLFVLKGLGVIITVILLLKSHVSSEILAKRFCAVGKNFDCDSVLNSNSAVIFKGLTFSEIGFYYFAGTWLITLFSNNHEALWQVLLLFNLLSLPVTFYSLYLQAFILKRFCILCCAVQIILWGEFFILKTDMSQVLIRPTYSELEIVIASLLLPVTIWLIAKKYITDYNQYKLSDSRLSSLKNNKDFFNKTLSLQPRFEIPGELDTILLGRHDANHRLSLISNPYCGPCSIAHREIERLINLNSDISLQIIFKNDSEKGENITEVALHMLSLKFDGVENYQKSVSEWFKSDKKEFGNWSEKYPVDIKDEAIQAIKKQSNWCKLNNISFTPFTLLNGHLLPEQYDLKDLEYLLA